jgi:hypothetical protein
MSYGVKMLKTPASTRKFRSASLSLLALFILGTKLADNAGWF